MKSVPERRGHELRWECFVESGAESVRTGEICSNAGKKGRVAFEAQAKKARPYISRRESAKELGICAELVLLVF